MDVYVEKRLCSFTTDTLCLLVSKTLQREVSAVCSQSDNSLLFPPALFPFQIPRLICKADSESVPVTPQYQQQLVVLTKTPSSECRGGNRRFIQSDLDLKPRPVGGGSLLVLVVHSELHQAADEDNMHRSAAPLHC